MCEHRCLMQRLQSCSTASMKFSFGPHDEGDVSPVEALDKLRSVIQELQAITDQQLDAETAACLTVVQGYTLESWQQADYVASASKQQAESAAFEQARIAEAAVHNSADAAAHADLSLQKAFEAERSIRDDKARDVQTKYFVLVSQQDLLESMLSSTSIDTAAVQQAQTRIDNAQKRLRLREHKRRSDWNQQVVYTEEASQEQEQAACQLSLSSHALQCSYQRLPPAAHSSQTVPLYVAQQSAHRQPPFVPTFQNTVSHQQPSVSMPMQASYRPPAPFQAMSPHPQTQQYSAMHNGLAHAFQAMHVQNSAWSPQHTSRQLPPEGHSYRQAQQPLQHSQMLLSLSGQRASSMFPTPSGPPGIQGGRRASSVMPTALHSFG